MDIRRELGGGGAEEGIVPVCGGGLFLGRHRDGRVSAKAGGDFGGSKTGDRAGLAEEGCQREGTLT